MVIGIVTVEDLQELVNKVNEIEANFNQLVQELQEVTLGQEEPAQRLEVPSKPKPAK